MKARRAYAARIDGGQGGTTTIRATDIEAALAQAIAWAKKGDWAFAFERPRPPNEVDENDWRIYVVVERGSESRQGTFLPWDLTDAEMGPETREAKRRCPAQAF